MDVDFNLSLSLVLDYSQYSHNYRQIKVDFGDFSFLHIKPNAVRYVSGVATAILGSGGMWLLFVLPRGKLY
jgi:hypothetical protein